jgi:AcrR family transcriptional regulator
VTKSESAARQGRGGGADVECEGRIAEALLDLSFERGYRNVDLPMLLGRVGIDEAAFHRHFADLEDCFVSVLEELSEEFLVAAAAAGSEKSWRAQIRAVAYRILRFLKEDDRRAHFLFVESPKGGDRAQLIRDRGLEAMFDLIDRGRAELADPQSISRATSEALAGTIFNQIQIAIEQQALDAIAVPPLMYAVVLPYVGAEVAAEELSIPPEDGR